MPLSLVRSITRTQLIVDIAIASALFLLVLPSTLHPGDARIDGVGAILLALAVSLVLAAALAIRRLSPALALAVAWLAAILQMLGGFPPIGIDLAIFGVLYATAAYGTRAVVWAGGVSAVAGGVTITAYLLVPPALASPAGRDATLQYLLIAGLSLVAWVLALGVAWTLGLLARTARRARANRDAQRRAEADAAAEAWRTRIARDMHDVVAHSLAVVIAQADGARYAAASDPDATADALATIAATARAALGDVRLLLAQLRHRQEEGPQPGLADLDELYAQLRAAGVELVVETDAAPARPPAASVQLAVYRIVQEAATNALRHGAPGPVRLRLSWLPHALELRMANPVASAASPARSGHGLVGMSERAALVGGSLSAAPDGAGSFVVTARIPLEVAA